MSIYSKIILVIVFVIAVIQLSAQKNIENIDSLAGRFISQVRRDVDEKLMVQTNKSMFVAGEDVWFKAWVVNNASHKYYKRSQTLYVDLVNEQDSVVYNTLLHIPSEKTEGQLPISKFFSEGQYWLRFYTANMLKKDSSSILVVPIYIVNPKLATEQSVSLAQKIDSSSVSVKEKILDPIIELYPEGGNLIAGTNAIIGLRTLDADGKPIAVEGYVMDSKDNTIETWFTTESKWGLGKCQFFVSKSHKYFVHIKYKGKQYSNPLPLVNHYASQISVKDESSNYIKIVIAQGDSIYKKGLSTYLLGVNKDSLCFASEGADMYELSIPKSNFPEGISRLLLFDDKKNIVSERSIYIQKEKSGLVLQTDQPIYNKRELVDLRILNMDSLTPTPLSSLAVSVIGEEDKESQDKNSLAHWYTNLKLAEFDTIPALRHLQILAQPFLYLGQHFQQSNDYLTKQSSPVLLDSTITDMKGRVVSKKNIAMPNRVVTLYSKAGTSFFDTDTTDMNGEFSFSLPLLADSVPFTLQVANIKGNKLDEKIIIEAKSIFPKFKTPASLKTRIHPQLVYNYKATAPINDIYIGTGKEWLQTVTVKTAIKKNSYNTSKRVSNFSQVVTGESLQKIGNTDASAAILTIPGLHLRSGFVTLGGVAGFTVSEKDEPLLIIDGVMVAGATGPQVDDGATADASPIFNSSPVLAEISRITTDMIDFIEVLRGPEAAYYGSRSTNGVIIINTHRYSNFRTRLEGYGSITYYPKSYQVVAPFVLPEYDNVAVKNSKFNDFRSTIYWNGHLYTNAKGNANVQFYTGDNVNGYTISVTGINAAGEIVQKKKKILIKE